MRNRSRVLFALAAGSIFSAVNAAETFQPSAVYIAFSDGEDAVCETPTSVQLGDDKALAIVCKESSSAALAKPLPQNPGNEPIGYYEGNRPYYAGDQDGVGSGTLYIPNQTNPTTIVYDTKVSQTYHPGCAGAEAGSYAAVTACRNRGTLKGGVTYVQRIPAGTSAAQITGASQAIVSDVSTYKIAVTDKLILNDDFRLPTVPGIPAKCVKATGYTVSFGCGLTKSAKYIEFTATGTKGAKCGNGTITCRATVIVR